jgi:dTDP-4-amino-4,6-dideoxygalactose transaminase
MYPVAKRINERGFYIGCHDGLTRDDLDYVLESFEEYFK